MKALDDFRSAIGTLGWTGTFILLSGMTACGVAGFYLTARLLETDTRKFAESLSTESFYAGANGMRLLGKGWSTPEPWGTWSLGSKAEIMLKLGSKPAGDVQLVLEARGFPFQMKNLQKINVSVNGAHITSLEPNFEGAIRNAELNIPAKVAILRDPMHVVFEIARPTSPRDLNLGSDTREIGIGLMGATVRYKSEVGGTRTGM